MNNTFSLQQMSETGNVVSKLILREYKLDLMARFMEKNLESKDRTRSNSKRIGLFK